MSGPSILEKPISFEPFLYPVAEEIKLPTVSEDRYSSGFLEVFSTRRSVKKIGRCPLESLSKVLYYIQNTLVFSSVKQSPLIFFIKSVEWFQLTELGY